MRTTNAVGVAMILGLVASGVREAQGDVATPEEMRLVCENWLSYMVNQRGGWAGEVEPKIADVQQIIADDGHTVLAHCFSVVPRGYVVVPVLRELPPIKAYSEVSELDVTQTVGMPQLLREVLEDRIGLYVWKYGSLDATQPPTGDVLLARGNGQTWGDFLAEANEFDTAMKAGAFPQLRYLGPLLSTAWVQGPPYNNFCPMGDGGRTVVGCVATAMSQVMRYHQWPANGVGSYSYYWDGDDSCGAPGPPYPGAGTVSATLSDTYDWANMPNNCTSGCTSAQQNALAELCHEAGVTLDMDYGVCGSGTPTSYTRDALKNYFQYDPVINRVWRSNYSATVWFDMIKTDLNANHPIIYRIKNHAIVCDGWRVQSSLNQYHMNYGWADSHTAWYTLDGLYCPWAGCGTSAEYMVRNIKPMSDVPQSKWSQLPHGPYEGFDEPSNFWWNETPASTSTGVADADGAKRVGQTRSDNLVNPITEPPKVLGVLTPGEIPDGAARHSVVVPQPVPEGTPPLDDRGSRVSTLVYENTDDSAPTYIAAGASGFVQLGDDVALAGTERKLVSYDVRAYSPNANYDLSTQLYTDASGYPGTPISGTFCGLGIGSAGFIIFTCTPSAEVTLPNNVWIVLTFGSQQPLAGWVVAEQAEIGSTADVFAAHNGSSWGRYTINEHYAGFWAHIECEGVNKVVADDFQSDGRPIDGLRWWGSYFDDLYSPWYYDPPYTMDGWFISFQHDEVIYDGCPPDVLIDGHPTALGIYYCPVGAVEWEELYPDCFESHLVWKYAVDLSDCCLLCSEQDPRTGHYPATADEFREEAELWYWLDIQAVTGVTWDPPDCDYEDRVPTGNLPPTWTQGGHFWGWHTSPEHNRYEACTGRIYDLPRYPPDCWDYSDWDATSWKCPPPVELVDMAFELLTPSSSCPTTDPPTQPPGEAGYEKIRYISMEPGNPGQQTALRVTLKTLPPPFGGLNDTKCWVGEPQQVSENAGKIVHEPGWPDFMSANLQGSPYCMDWSTVEVLHVTDDEIIPSAVYDVQAIDCECDFDNEANYSAPLTITTSKWGDSVGTCAVIPCTPPEGVVNMASDVTACFDKFRNLAGAVLKSRADIEPNLPDGLVNISDCTFELDAFRGFAYPPAQTPPSLAWPTGPDGCP